MRRRMERAGARREGGRWFGREGGLSLVEIVVGLAILVIALGGICAVVTQAIRSFGGSEDFLDVQQNARVGLGKVGEEAKWAQAVQVSTAACPSASLDPACLSLQIPPDNPLRNPPTGYQVSFRWNNTAQQLERVEGGTTTPLAGYGTGVTFRYLGADGLDTIVPANVVRVIAEIQVQRGDTSTRVVGSDVFLRNAVPTPGPPRNGDADGDGDPDMDAAAGPHGHGGGDADRNTATALGRVISKAERGEQQCWRR